jgi:UDP-glucose 4-epimerase
LQNVDYVFHLAAEKYNSPGASFDSILDTNVIASNKLFEACAKSNVKKVFFASSLYAYGSLGPSIMKETDLSAPITYYGMSKLAGENLLRINELKFNLKWVAARLFFIYGPGQYVSGGYKSVIIKNFENLKNGTPCLINGSGQQSLDYVFVKDCCQAIYNLTVLSELCSEIYNISSGSPTSVTYLINKMTEISGVNDSQICNLPSDWTEGSKRHGSNQKIQSALGWRPSTNIESGLKETWDWLVSNGKN